MCEKGSQEDREGRKEGGIKGKSEEESKERKSRDEVMSPERGGKDAEGSRNRQLGENKRHFSPSSQSRQRTALLPPVSNIYF